MTYKEAIEILHPKTSNNALSKIEYYGGFEGVKAMLKAVEEARAMACEAMNKQIPEKFETDSVIMPYSGGVEDYTANCRSCGSFLAYKTDAEDENYQVNFCPCCGQAIDWEGISEDE